MSTTVEQIKERLSIADVLSTYIKVEKSGINFKARCPFHNEKTPSFFISPARNSYYCFGCGAKGDIFSFVQTFEGLDFKGSLKLLADRAGVSLKNETGISRDAKEKLFEVVELATMFFEQELQKNPQAQEYLKTRGVTSETIKSFRIGFAPDGWRTLSTYLQGKKISEAILQEVGLIKKTEKTAYDRFRNRIMFPLCDSSGRVIGFSGRTLVDDENSPKYLNSPETPLFDKSSVLYGLDKAKEDIRKRGYAILVEGQFDLLLSHQAGVRNTVAASGTALSDEAPSGDRGVTNLQMISRLSKNVVFAFDGDTAGVKATYRGSLLALGLGMDVKIAELPEGVDPADVIRKSKDDWIRILKDTKDAVTFFTSFFTKKVTDARVKAHTVYTDILPLVAKMPSALDREHFLEQVRKITGLSLDALRVDLERVIQNKTLPVESETLTTIQKKKHFSYAERLYGIIFWQEKIPKPMVDVDSVTEQVQTILGEKQAILLRDMLGEDKEALAFQAEDAYSETHDIEKEVILLIGKLHMSEINKELGELAIQVRTQEDAGKDVQSLLEEIHKKNQLLEKIQSTLQAP